MTHDRTPRLERLLEQTARMISGGGLHPVELLQRVQAAVQRGVRDGQVPNLVRVTLHPADYQRYFPAFEDLRGELDVLLDRAEDRERWTRIGDRRITFEAAEGVPAGVPRVTATFGDTANRSETAPPAGATQVIRRHRNARLVLSDGTRVQLTHTPFRIGRGPGNDLVYPSLALSRSHAEITSGPEGLEIHDLGSRNGLVADGARVDRARFEQGRHYLLGDLDLWLEYEP